MMSSTVTVNDRKFHYRLEKYEDTLYAECIEIPAIVVYGANESEVQVELEKAIRGYIKTFDLPDLRPATPA